MHFPYINLFQLTNHALIQPPCLHSPSCIQASRMHRFICIHLACLHTIVHKSTNAFIFPCMHSSICLPIHPSINPKLFIHPFFCHLSIVLSVSAMQSISILITTFSFLRWLYYFLFFCPYLILSSIEQIIFQNSERHNGDEANNDGNADSNIYIHSDDSFNFE